MTTREAKLKADLQNALRDRDRLEAEVQRLKRELRESRELNERLTRERILDTSSVTP